jgi:hypothetical protein
MLGVFSDLPAFQDQAHPINLPYIPGLCNVKGPYIPVMHNERGYGVAEKVTLLLDRQ